MYQDSASIRGSATLRWNAMGLGYRDYTHSARHSIGYSDDTAEATKSCVEDILGT